MEEKLTSCSSPLERAPPTQQQENHSLALREAGGGGGNASAFSPALSAPTRKRPRMHRQGLLMKPEISVSLDFRGAGPIKKMKRKGGGVFRMGAKSPLRGVSPRVGSNINPFAHLLGADEEGATSAQSSDGGNVTGTQPMVSPVSSQSPAGMLTVRAARIPTTVSMPRTVSGELLTPRNMSPSVMDGSAAGASGGGSVRSSKKFPPPPPLPRGHRSKIRLGPYQSPSPSSKSATGESARAAKRTRSPRDRYQQDFEEISLIGRGNFGSVFKVKKRLDGCLYAVKRTDRAFRGRAERKQMLQEVFALAAAATVATRSPSTNVVKGAEGAVANNSARPSEGAKRGAENLSQDSNGSVPLECPPNIVRYFNSWVEDGHLFIQTELCDHNLKQIAFDEELRSQKLPNEAALCEVLRQLLVGLNYLHIQGLVHLDLKPANLLLKNRVYKIGDLGMVTHADGSGSVEEGDSRYMAKELLADDWSQLPKADVFSLGASIYEVAIGRALPTNGEEWHAIRKGDLKLCTRFNRLAASPSADVAAASTTKSLPPIHVSMDFLRLLKRMMHPDPARRPTCAELLKEALLRSDVELRRAAKEDLLRRQFLSAVGHDPARPTSCPPRLFRPLH